jgi:hypothetical protein
MLEVSLFMNACAMLKANQVMQEKQLAGLPSDERKQCSTFRPSIDQ